MPKRRRSGSHLSGLVSLPSSKRQCVVHPDDRLSTLSDELLIRILRYLPISILLRCELLSHRFRRLSLDSQLWRRLYFNRFVLPRALRIPRIKASASLGSDGAAWLSHKRVKWLDEASKLRKEGLKGNKNVYWKGRYKLRHNWARGACEIGELFFKDGKEIEKPTGGRMLVNLAEGFVITVDKMEGMRAWDLKAKTVLAQTTWEGCPTPTCLAVDEQELRESDIRIAVGLDGMSWEIWILDVRRRIFVQMYKSPMDVIGSGNLSAVAYAHPYVLTITQAQKLSLYSFLDAYPLQQVEAEIDNTATKGPKSFSVISPPHLLASLTSNTTWPPLCLSIRLTPNILIASVAYSLPTYLSGFTVGLQELCFSLRSSPSFPLLISSRLTSAQPEGFQPLSAEGIPSSRSPTTVRATNLSYAHPYILATHPDNTLTLHLCTSTKDSLSIDRGTKLWGHTSGISSAEITSRGKAVSVSARGEELRVWDLEGGGHSNKRNRDGDCVVVKALPEKTISKSSLSTQPLKISTDMGPMRQWIGFDDEVVIVFKEGEQGTRALMVYDFA